MNNYNNQNVYSQVAYNKDITWNAFIVTISSNARYKHNCIVDLTIHFIFNGMLYSIKNINIFLPKFHLLPEQNNDFLRASMSNAANSEAFRGDPARRYFSQPKWEELSWDF